MTDSRFRSPDHRLEDGRLEETLRDLDHDLPVGHPDPEDLALWLEGGGQSPQRAEIEQHLATCSECRSVVLDASFALNMDSGTEIEDPSESSEGLEDLSHRYPKNPAHRRPARRVGRALALAAALLLSILSFRLLSVDPRLGALGVSRNAVARFDARR